MESSGSYVASCFSTRYQKCVHQNFLLHSASGTRPFFASKTTALAEFLTRNLLFVDHVALMGLEMTGFTKANIDDLWIDPADYADELRQAVGILDRARVKTSIYNTQLCVLDRSLWPFARRSISDWKQEYMPECTGCGAKDQCGGFFSSAMLRYSEHIKPIAAQI